MSSQSPFTHSVHPQHLAAAAPLYWQDPSWYPDEPDVDPYDWRWYVVPLAQAAWLSMTDEQKREIAFAAQRLGELQQRIVEAVP